MHKLMKALQRASDILDREKLHKNMKSYTKEEYAVLYLETENLIRKAKEFRNVNESQILE